MRFDPMRAPLILAAVVGALVSMAAVASATPASSPVAHAPAVHKLKALDADNHTIVLNRPGLVTVVLGTNEDSQDAARAAGEAMYPLQGRPDFQLIVVVDLRDSIAGWVPSVVLGRMRASLDEEAVELKPYYKKNGTKNNPRPACYVVPDFSGTVCPELGWTEKSDNLRGILFGTNGREIMRWDKIDDNMVKLQTDVRAAIQVLIDADKEKAAEAAKGQGTKLMQPSSAHPPLLPLAPPPSSD
jgi:hypothetical protein